MVSAELSIVQLSATSAEAVIRALAARLREHGHVHPSFEAAAVAREKRSPTGLPFEPRAVALPHAEPEHVITPAVAIATLATPVRFREMGSPATQLEVSLVVMPAFSAKEQAGAGLTQIIELLQDAALREELALATTPSDISAIFARSWKP